MNIGLTQGRTAIVDDNINEEISKVKWTTFQAGRNIYAYRQVDDRSILMHRVIWEKHNGPIPPGMFIDHINRDGLDNRLENLRLCNTQQNACNSNKYARRTSQFKGVCWEPRHQRWRATIKKDRKYYLGEFRSEKEAAMAYDRKAKELFGEFAGLNFKEGE